MLDRIDQALDVAAADLEFVALAGQQRRLTHPDEIRIEGARQRRTMIRVHQHVAARQVDFVLEHDGHGLRGARLLERTVGGGDLAHLARLARGQRQHGIAHGDLAARDGAGVTAEVGIRPAHELDREAQFLQQIRCGRLRCLRAPRAACGPVYQGVSLVPRMHHVHAEQRRDRDHFDVLHAELARVGDELARRWLRTCAWS